MLSRPLGAFFSPSISKKRLFLKKKTINRTWRWMIHILCLWKMYSFQKIIYCWKICKLNIYAISYLYWRAVEFGVKLIYVAYDSSYKNVTCQCLRWELTKYGFNYFICTSFWFTQIVNQYAHYLLIFSGTCIHYSK